MKITEKLRKNISYIFSSVNIYGLLSLIRTLFSLYNILLDLIPRRLLAMPVCIMIKKIIKGFSSLSFIRPYVSISLNIPFMANGWPFFGDGHRYKNTTTYLIDYFDLAYSLIKLTPSIVL